MNEHEKNCHARAAALVAGLDDGRRYTRRDLVDLLIAKHVLGAQLRGELQTYSVSDTRSWKVLKRLDDDEPLGSAFANVSRHVAERCGVSASEYLVLNDAVDRVGRQVRAPHYPEHRRLLTKRQARVADSCFDLADWLRAPQSGESEDDRRLALRAASEYRRSVSGILRSRFTRETGLGRAEYSAWVQAGRGSRPHPDLPGAHVLLAAFWALEGLVPKRPRRSGSAGKSHR